ncbi:MAG: hypothetical protein ABEI53_03025 [Candidatus Magasanikbacteria bacterium]
MNQSTPKIIFKYAYPLDSNRRRLFEKKNLGEYPEFDEVKKEVSKWKNFWKDFNKDNRVIEKIIDLTGLVYPHDIEAFVIGAGLNPMSTPLILPMQRMGNDYCQTKGERAEIIMHEILHKFVGDPEMSPKTEEYWDTLREKYSEEPTKTQNHIIIYALLIKLFEKFLPEENIEDFVNEDFSRYVKALEIAQNEGADNLIEEFQELTKE